ncbi:unnamed protein product [Lymnaea stagnalis]|uniref:Uncharacterized protein n=1 Tax=Lymnaea stagnalis TaxID=6523 RepID=A0AAV2IAF2_LYMST
MHAYSVAFSELDQTTPLSFMGAILEGGYPFGLVIGSCGDSARSADCNVTDPPLKMFAEMVVPGSAFGKDFVGFNFPGIFNMTLMYFMSLTDNAVIQISRSKIEAEDEILHLEYAGDTKSFPMEQSALAGFRIQSSKPVQIILLQQAPCLAYSVQMRHTGDATISLILPNSLFYIKYTWWSPPIANTIPHVVVVIRIEDRVKLRLHHQLL